PPSFKQRGGPLEILQLWVNLPSRLKMTAPRYSGVQADGIPALPLAEGKALLNLIAGEFQGSAGPIHSLTGVFMSTVTLQAGAQVSLPAPRGRSVFLYVVSGQVSVGGTAVKPWHLVTVNDDGDTLAIGASSDAVLLFGHADPIDEPVVAHGPFVMNTRGEIEQAIRDYQAGKFNGDGKLLEVGA
uniref:pirin family protein n=1 Tax=Pseudomonas sp. TaxID=306 RepID=UPI00258E2BCD